MDSICITIQVVFNGLLIELVKSTKHFSNLKRFNCNRASTEHALNDFHLNMVEKKDTGNVKRTGNSTNLQRLPCSMKISLSLSGAW